MGKKLTVGLLVLLAPAVGSSQALAQETATPPDPTLPDPTPPPEASPPEETTPAPIPETTPEPEPSTIAPAPAPLPPAPPPQEPPSVIERVGLSLSVGGGVTGFTDTEMADAADVGGLWDVRMGFLTNSWVGAELAYLGGLQNIDALGLDSEAQLLSTTFEGALRANLTRGMIVQPYVFAGVAWRHYSLTNADVNLSSVEDEDDLMEVPMGLGVGFRTGGFLVDVRGSYRPTTGDDLVPTRDGTGQEDLDSWMAAARLGYSF
jgi:hypothetical protein